LILEVQHFITSEFLILLYKKRDQIVNRADWGLRFGMAGGLVMPIISADA
jgi:hypothetical protein